MTFFFTEFGHAVFAAKMECANQDQNVLPVVENVLNPRNPSSASSLKECLSNDAISPEGTFVCDGEHPVKVCGNPSLVH